MKGVVLAAGLAGIDPSIEALASVGFEEVAVVAVQKDGLLCEYLEDGARHGVAVYCIENPYYLRGLAASIYAARAYVGGEPFVLCMPAFVPGRNVLLALLSCSRGAHAMAVDTRSRRYARRRRRIRVELDDRGSASKVGERLRHWHAIVAGSFVFQPSVFAHISSVLMRSNGTCTMTALLSHMIAVGDTLRICDISTALWADRFSIEYANVLTPRVLTVGWRDVADGSRLRILN